MMGEFIHTLHSAVRYVVLLTAVAVVVLSAVQWSRTTAEETRMQRIAMTAFVGTLDLQALLGITLLALWAFYPALIGHIAMLLLAVAVAHIGLVMARRREPARSGAPIRLAAVAVALVLIVGGIMAIQRPVL
jgi:hypothetical protein